MAKKSTKKKSTKKKPAAGIGFTGKKLVEFDRHITGPPRRSKGQRVWLTPALARRQGLKPDDFHVVTR